MKTINPTLKFFIDLARIQAVMARRFDGRLGAIHGLGFNDFVILYHLSQAPDEKLRRIDLAEKIGLTASGVTRMLAPMEKIGLIKREANAQDARVSYVSLAPGGRRLLKDALETAEVLSQDIIPASQQGNMEALSGVFSDLGRTIM
jgi:DNA-binding MarR family transcriptional regulator